MSWRDRLEVHGPALALIAAPFVAYAAFIRRALHPVEYPDSFAYLWRQPFNVYYLWGRSLTQRAIYSLVGNRPPLIVGVQLLCFLGTALLLYLCLRRERGAPRAALHNLALGALIALLFTSYTLSLSAVVINSEPIFICLVIGVPCAMALYQGPGRRALLLILGTAFILGKNVAPYTYVLFVLAWLVTMVVRKAQVDLAPHALLIALALVRIGVTSRYDTSIHLNVMGNMYRRVFSRPEVTAHFYQRYGMPVGPFVEQCKGEWVGVQCFGYPISRIDSHTQNFTLIEDEYGFTDWVKEKGQRSYLHFVLFENGWETWTHYRGMIAWAAPQSARFMTDYLGAQIPENDPNNLAQIVARLPGGERGLFGVDALALIDAALRWLGFDLPELVLGYAVLGLALLIWVRPSRFLALGVSALAAALGMYFLTIYGSSMEVVRHTLPAWILLLVGGVFYWIGVVDVIVRLMRGPATRGSRQTALRGERP